MMHSNSRQASRWGGLLLGVGAFAYLVAVLIFIVAYGQPQAGEPGATVAMADRVAHYSRHQGLAHAMWIVELCAALMIAIGSFTLQHRRCAGSGWLSDAASWNTVGLGAVVLVLMYLIMLGGYPEASLAFASEPGLMSTLNAVSSFIFSFGNAIVFLGLVLAFSLESRVSLPVWLGRTGMLVSVVACLASVGMLSGLAAFEPLAPLGLVAYLLTACLGIAVWRAPGDS